MSSARKGNLAVRRIVHALLSWNLTHPSAAGADDDWNKNDPAAKFATKTPIKHVVVIFDENNSFDHYFGTYPNALKLPGEISQFHPAPDTPLVNGLTPALLTNCCSPKTSGRSWPEGFDCWS